MSEPPAPPWRRIAVAAYGPTTLSSIGFGAITPLVAISALHMGASVGTSAFISGLLGIGTLVGDLPAGWVAERLGEKRAIVGACLVDAVALLAAFFSTSVWQLGLAVFFCGLSGAVFGLARQAYLTEAVPLRYRARALSTLGGVFRIGFLVGPLIGAAVVSTIGLSAAYAFAAGMCLLAAAATLTLPDLPGTGPVTHADRNGPSIAAVLRMHVGVLATQGVAALLLMLVRSARLTILPLWCGAHGLSPAATSLVFSVSMAFDVALFFLGGSLMDRFGRVWVAAPAMVVMGIGMVLLPLATTTAPIVAVAALLGLGNGISSGVVMTIGSDVSPAQARTKFLAGWRLMSDSGSTLGPLLIAGISAVAPLGLAAVALGFTAWGGAAWLVRWIPRYRDGGQQPTQ